MGTVTTTLGERKRVIIIRPDLVGNDGSELFMVAIPNDLDEQQRQRKTEWKIEYLMTRQQMVRWLRLEGKAQHLLPKSSRREHSYLGLWAQIDRGMQMLGSLKFEDVTTLKGQMNLKTALHRK